MCILELVENFVVVVLVVVIECEFSVLLVQTLGLDQADQICYPNEKSQF